MSTDLKRKARAMGVDRVHALTGCDRIEINRWMNGGVNPTVAAKFAAALETPEPPAAA